MKKVICVLLLSFCISSLWATEDSDQKIKQIITSGNFFELERQYPLLQDNLTPYTKELAQTYLFLARLQRQEAYYSILSLLEKYQDELGSSGFSELYFRLVWMLIDIAEYDMAYQYVSDIMNNTGTAEDMAVLSDFCNLLQYMSSYLPEQNWNTGSDIIEIPYEVENGYIYIPVRINGRNVRALLDTAAGGYLLVAENQIEKLDIDVFEGFELDINGSMINDNAGYVGVMESFDMGDAGFKNIMTTVFSINKESMIQKEENIIMLPDSITQRYDIIIGCKLIERLGEIQIYPKEKIIKIPAWSTERSETSFDMRFLQSQTPHIEITANGEKLLATFDTGAEVSDLLSGYVARHREYLDNTFEKEPVRRGGIGGGKEMQGYVIPSFSFTIGEKDYTLENINAVIDPDFVETKDVLLGMDFINQFNRVTISFRGMFVDFE